MKRLSFAAAALALMTGGSQAQVADDPEIAAKLEAMGNELSREVVGGTMGIYAPLHAGASLEGLSVHRDQAYGDHERHRLDVVSPEGADGSLPVAVFVHGGGFVRGDKGAPYISGIAPYFARHGIVGVMMNYRFAPDNTWPSGAEDVAQVLDWIAANPEVHGGDPSKVILVGNSAGAMHVADYAFHEEFQREADGVVGAVLISPPTVDLTTRPVDPARDALYYGVEGDRAAQSVVNHLDGRRMPVMVAYAEYEPQVIMEQVAQMIGALTARDSRLPHVASAAGHNHISVVAHIGTADETLGPDLVEFIRAVARD